MKPSERRAMEAEKRAMREAAERERELEKQAAGQKKAASPLQEPARESIDTSAPYTKPREEEIKVQGDGYHREGFFGRNARLIAFIITMTVLLTVLAPWGIDLLVTKNREEIFGDTVEDKKDITADAILALSDLGGDLRWSHLDAFNYTDYSSEYVDKNTGKKSTYYTREYALTEALVLRVGGYDLGGAPDMARLIDYDSGEYVADIRKDSVRAFLSSRGY